MYERCLSEAERVVAARKEVVPVKIVWQEVTKQAKRQGFEIPTIADFTAMLEADSRFEFLPAVQNVTEQAELSPDSEDLDEIELEKLGFFGEDCIRLKQVRLSEDLEDNELNDNSPPVKISLTKQPRHITRKSSPRDFKRKAHSRATRGNRVPRRSVKRAR